MRRHLTAALAIAAAVGLVTAAAPTAAAVGKGTVARFDYYSDATHKYHVGWAIIDGCGNGSSHGGQSTAYYTQVVNYCS